ncbi:hypothetical protein [Micromonospora sp. RL09-050-HVF-A]|uniref:hypothetical protein n=1 Tax=Micromonospora sp. RL09-050-HVF-A TaxID=1703433 RepID=UPI001C6013F1|nr:hypothetical protein [Micromonospora sp. RL09-050-HVF-A]MBW4700976.1 hypothetical protein [Micromonospora sp. RL09-050-HVF-A]
MRAGTVPPPAPPAAPGHRPPVTRATARSPEPVTVHVHIDRIEVRLAGNRRPATAPAATTPATAAPAVAAGPAPELESYLRGAGVPR